MSPRYVVSRREYRTSYARPHTPDRSAKPRRTAAESAVPTPAGPAAARGTTARRSSLIAEQEPGPVTMPGEFDEWPIVGRDRDSRIEEVRPCARRHRVSQQHRRAEWRQEPDVGPGLGDRGMPSERVHLGQVDVEWRVARHDVEPVSVCGIEPDVDEAGPQGRQNEPGIAAKGVREDDSARSHERLREVVELPGEQRGRPRDGRNAGV